MKNPWHLWVVGILAIIWNAYGCFLYWMMATRSEAYLETLSPEQMIVLETIPAFSMGLFAISVWGSLIASILLLLKRSIASLIFTICFACIAFNMIYSHFIFENAAPMSVGEIFINIMVVVIALFLLIYSRAMSRSGVLR